ncbi:hypothetical protein AB1Y20_007708 [Prymnesium parvum]|uniref:CBF1-interacting co-repressor CIR N-terminal domain-containing protein n=1 Tax=Prymnesium parvum TaxID=97485 RepID=A0AB34IY94_PRYPA|mmetsp:Transcript_34789/g.86536  ORF Transcript_34789/g.86536 Transcript_34789/m.86536 type:complete len:309 (+) Transcript_34789:40-966(+)
MGEKAMSFLNNKSFHPGNAQNRYKLFEAEEKKKNEERKKEELKREFEQQQAKRELVGTLKGGDPTAPMAFMYQQPPGMVARQSREKTPAERDVERHGDLLANAPRQGAYTTQMEVTHKPFGVELRKVRCTKCGAWGHQQGDRECALRNEIHELDLKRREKEDPVARLAGTESSGAALRWAPKAAPDVGIHGDAASNDPNQQFVTAVDDEEVARAALAEGTLTDNDILAQVNPELLAMLNQKQQRKLIKQYRERLLGDGEGREKKRKKKEKKKREKSHKEKKRDGRKDKKRKRSSSSSDNGSSSSEEAP